MTNYSLATNGSVTETKMVSGAICYKATRNFNGQFETQIFRFKNNAEAWAGI